MISDGADFGLTKPNHKRQIVQPALARDLARIIGQAGCSHRSGYLTGISICVSECAGKL